MTSVVGPAVVIPCYPPTRPSLLARHVLAPFCFPRDFSPRLFPIVLSFSLFLTVPYPVVSAFSSSRQGNELASTLITTRPKSYVEFICRATARSSRYGRLFFTSKSPGSRGRGRNILSLFNLIARARSRASPCRPGIYADDFY